MQTDKVLQEKLKIIFVLLTEVAFGWASNPVNREKKSVFRQKNPT